MNKHTLENLLIFAILYANTHENNKGVVYNSYLGPKSMRYLGIDITKIENITIEDFTIRTADSGHFQLTPRLPNDILERIKNKLDINELSNNSNIIDDGLDYFGNKRYTVSGYDNNLTVLFKIIYIALTDEYFTKTLRDFKSYSILKD